MTLDLQYDHKKAPNGWIHSDRYPFIESAGIRLMPVMAFYGPNTSGKTSILEAVHALALLAKGRSNSRSNFYRPNLLHRPADPSTRMEIAWTASDACFHYAVEVSEEEVLEEGLYLDEVPLFQIKNGVVFLQSSAGRAAVEEVIRLQCLATGTSKQIRTAFASIVQSFPGFDSRINFAFNSLNVDYLDFAIEPVGSVQLLASTFKNVDSSEREKAALELISRYLSKLDIRIKRIEMEKLRSDLSSLPLQVQTFIQSFPHPMPASFDFYELKAVHAAEDGKETAFKLTEESRGTQRLIQLLGFLLAVIRSGSTALVDGLDDSLHPALLPQLVKLFTFRDFNEQGAQLLFTVHNTELLAADDLSISEIALVSQNGFAGTKVRRLSSFHDVRNVNDFRRRYIMGHYDAVPAAFI